MAGIVIGFINACCSMQAGIGITIINVLLTKIAFVSFKNKIKQLKQVKKSYKTKQKVCGLVKGSS